MARGPVVSNFAGYLQLRRAIFEHVRDGRLAHMEALAYIYIASQADTRSGVWCGSSGALAGEFCCSERLARCLLENLSRKQYIKRFPTPGRHFCYPILVNKYLVTDGEHVGARLNAMASESWNLLVFEKNGLSPKQCVKLNVEQRVEHHVQQGTPQNRIKNRELRKENKNPAATPPVDPRFDLLHDFAYESFRAKHGVAPHWNGRDRKLLQEFLRNNREVTTDEFKRRWANFLTSTQKFFQEQGDSLGFFCSRFDSFIDGPLLERSNLKGGTGHAASIDERNLAAAGFRN